MAMLEVKDVTMQFGGLKALTDVDFHVDKGEIVALIGPNGAGKTTLFNLLTGIYRPTRGRVEFNSVSIVGKKAYTICRLGIARTFQNIRLFANMTTLENVMVARHVRTKASPFAAVAGTRGFRREERAIIDDARRCLRFVGLEEKANELAINLPYGEQRKLEIARALGTEPELVLLDEPAAGMNPQETASLTSLIARIRESGVTVLLIEHDMKVVMGIADRVSVLDFGVKIAEGKPEEIQRDPKVIEAYLGSGAEALMAEG